MPSALAFPNAALPIALGVAPSLDAVDGVGCRREQRAEIFTGKALFILGQKVEELADMQHPTRILQL